MGMILTNQVFQLVTWYHLHILGHWRAGASELQSVRVHALPTQARSGASYHKARAYID